MMRFVLIFCGVMGVAALLQELLLGASYEESGLERLGYAAGFALLLAWWLCSLNGKDLLRVLKGMAPWLIMMILLILAYGWRHEMGASLGRFQATLLPQRGFSQVPGSLSVFKSSDGHFYVEPRIQGVLVRMLVDTGASDIMLSRAAAKRIGLDLDQLDYTLQYRTANGLVRAAPVILEDLRLGDLVLRHLPASVNAGTSDSSLLGMAFFKKLDSYDVKNDLLTLRWYNSAQR
ncbi:retropepsin-like aspartic protease family protein [Candidatus Magnetaquicoccus inordinatus]|uniref:retropepsin-like aspartic protease family protein n=1 Tax=Candidatus Magnetaquicoccus inordinatus TaxID=2496818 RepID=UPI00102BCD18|nr:TIGR02281 family clan AA aspartic protease [Candidatus Magnetaquicoccus inordinatus]